LLDAALQACIGLLADDAGTLHRLTLPYALQELEMVAPCGATMWALVRFAADGPADIHLQTIDIDLCDEAGRICVRLRGLSLRAPAGVLGVRALPSEQASLSLLCPDCRRVRPAGSRTYPRKSSLHVR